MEFEEEVTLVPVSPNSEYLRSSALSLSILGILELEIPIDDSIAIPLVQDLFLPINPRFSSVMIRDNIDGAKKWKQVQVNLENHVRIPKFPDGLSTDGYDQCLTNYLSELAMEQFPEDRPLWEVHIIKYPTSNAAGIVIFKLHHSLGDGYSLMGALLSCLQNLDNPSLPVTFPSRKSTTTMNERHGCLKAAVPRFVSKIYNTVYDFGFAILKSRGIIPDDRSPLRSGVDGVEFLPISVVTMGFSMDQIKQIKNKLNVTVNDVISGVIMYGARLYMEAMEKKSGKAKATAMVLLNTRAAGVDYKSVEEMMKPNAEMPWGNHFAFLPISLPRLSSSNNPLSFVLDAHQMIKKKKSSASSFLMGKMLDAIRNIKGSEATSRFIHGSLKNTTMGLTNLIGPIEPLSLANHPVRGIYFVIAGPPQSISVSIVSYNGILRVAFRLEKDYIDPSKFRSSIETSFQTIFQTAIDPYLVTN